MAKWSSNRDALSKHVSHLFHMPNVKLQNSGLHYMWMFSCLNSSKEGPKVVYNEIGSGIIVHIIDVRLIYLDNCYQITHKNIVHLRKLMGSMHEL